MQLSGEQHVAAPRQRVWEALNDPEILRQCIPGCQSLDQEAEDRLAAVAEVRIGPIGARFRGTVTLSDRDPPNGYTIAGQGNGGIAGSAKGGARVRLSDDGAGTCVAYTVDAEVGGRMAQLGGPIIDATARQMAAKFFETFGAIVGAGAPVGEGGPVVESGVAAPVAAAPAPVLAPAHVGVPMRPALWGWVAAIVAAVLVGYFLGLNGSAAGIVALVLVLLIIVATASFEAGRRGGGR